ncbi:hypothetical protein BDW59DRAFT_164608 [Aspergillus cavernicola]|uniref:DUF7907 domain-containing protein n=1 Tax=Aspergillus cavernicola TaxID=176166 RepID=A0ABR4HYK0_9EURO
MKPSTLFFTILPLLLPQTLSTPTKSTYYLKPPSLPLYLSSSITFNGHKNYILLTNSSLAQPLSLYPADGSITIDTSNVIGASSQASLLLSNETGLNSRYMQVVLGDQMGGEYTKGFRFDRDNRLRFDGGVRGFGGFVACTAAKGVRQVYWFGDGDGEEVPVVCEVVEFERVWDLDLNE